MTPHSPATAWPYDVCVVTSAALPWRTGPAYLSLWHACGLAELGLQVAYVVPWLGRGSQRRLYGDVRFQDQAAMATWLSAEAQRLGCPPLPHLFTYPGYYSQSLRSIIARNLFISVPKSRSLVLEEAEHLCWDPLSTPRSRLDAQRVIGVLLTDYGYFIRRSGWPLASWLSKAVGRYHRRQIRRHTDLVVPLSPAVALEPDSHPQIEARISGVLSHYAAVPPVRPDNKGIYFLGRLVWNKGLDMLIELSCRLNLSIDVYGEGPDGDALLRTARERNASLRLLGHHPSPWDALPNYRVFINPSWSEVLCTATADALVAGRHVVLPDCPGNRPFAAYPNVHRYRDIAGAAAAVQFALTEPPQAPERVRRDFDWGNACRNLAQLL
ncbi:hypothetical protein CCR91_16195 [Thiorhodovibrio winogradskyi]|nr:hypothetical protein [Thiorhodovibrio winogradskyi]